MAKEKFNMGNLALPAKPAVVRPPVADTRQMMERAVETIHSPRQVDEPPPAAAAVPNRKISLDLPMDTFKFIKFYCVERDITMREYLLEIIERDIQVRQK